MECAQIKFGVKVQLDSDTGLIDDVSEHCFTIEWDDGTCRQTVPWNWIFLPDLKVVSNDPC